MALYGRIVLPQPGLSNTARSATPSLLRCDAKPCTCPHLTVAPGCVAPLRKLAPVNGLAPAILL